MGIFSRGSLGVKVSAHVWTYMSIWISAREPLNEVIGKGDTFSGVVSDGFPIPNTQWEKDPRVRNACHTHSWSSGISSAITSSSLGFN